MKDEYVWYVMNYKDIYVCNLLQFCFLGTPLQVTIIYNNVDPAPIYPHWIIKLN